MAALVVCFQKLSKNAYLYEKMTEDFTRLDLQSAYNYLITYKKNALILTNIEIKIPDGRYGRISPVLALPSNITSIWA